MKPEILLVLLMSGALYAQAPARSPFAEKDCTAAKLGTAIPAASIGEPVSAVTLNPPVWTAESDNLPAFCSVEGAMSPVTATGKPINFRVLLPASWSQRAAQLGGGGMDGSIPNLTQAPNVTTGPSLLARGFATYGSDSGHQSGPGRGGARAPAPPGANDWALSEEAVKNLAYMQLKKTHDAAMVLVQRAYGEKARFNYFFGTSQGGREALTVAQRYPADYDGIVANVPIVNFSSLMLGPELIRIQEKPIANWVTPTKVNAIRGEFIRQCDKLDGLADGIINNYMACRAIFDVKQGAPGRNPWAGKRCPGNQDPDPADTSANACLTDGQIATLQMVYSRYPFATPLANGVKSFGMWVPNTDPSGSGLIVPARFRGQEGATPDAPMHSHLGILGVTGFLMQDLNANPLDYVEGGALNGQRVRISEWLDSTNPDLTRFAQRGGKIIVTIGTNDTLASPGAQLDYYQSLIDKIGPAKLEGFARLFVIPQANHGLAGANYTVDGDGKTIPSALLPNTFDRLALVLDWVEKKVDPPKQFVVSAGERSLPLCPYPSYPKYRSGPPADAASYQCAR
jgi:pimeloyl-ACP methyl ester carboxylesterase